MLNARNILSALLVVIYDKFNHIGFQAIHLAFPVIGSADGRFWVKINAELGESTGDGF
jgi:hypothetical protein